MESTDTYTVAVSKEIHVSQARQLGAAIAESLGFGATERCIISTCISELANNLVFHTNCGGTICIRVLDRNGKKGIEIIADDKGPGIRDIRLAMQDGYSTCGGMGCGLGGVKRLMHEFEIRSEPGEGTRITARKWR